MTSIQKKKRNNMIIMISVIAILVVMLVIIKLLTIEEDEIKTEDVSYALTTLKSSQISQVTYDYRDGMHASYIYKDKTWYNADDEEFPLSSSGFENQFVTSFVELKSTRKITEYVEDMSIFGLEDPYLTVKVTGSAGEITSYKVGNYNPTIDEYYLMINDDKDNIYLISKNLEYICRKDIYDYATVDSFPGYSLSSLDYIQFESGSDVSKLLYSKEGLEEDITGYGWKWFFDKPFGRKIPCEASKMDTMLEEMISTFDYTKTVNYKATVEDITSYGLDNPKGSYSYYFNKEDEDGNVLNCSVTVYIGNASDKDSGYYTREVKRIGLTQEISNVVRLVSTTVAEAIIGINPLDYICSNVFFLVIDDIANSDIVFTTLEQKVTLSYKPENIEDNTKDTYMVDGVVVEDQKFKDIWLEMVSLKPERIVFDKTLLKDSEPVYTIAANRVVDDYYGDITVNFIKYDSTYYQIEINGLTDMLMRKRDVDNFFNNIIEYSQSIIE